MNTNKSIQELSDEQIESLREIGQSWMTESGRDALDDWIDTNILATRQPVPQSSRQSGGVVNGIERCPFCGHAAEVQNDFGRVFWIQCKNLACGSTDGTEHAHEGDAIANWNRSYHPPADAAPEPEFGLQVEMTAKGAHCSRRSRCGTRQQGWRVMAE